MSEAPAGLAGLRVAVAGASSYLARRAAPILAAQGALLAPILRDPQGVKASPFVLSPVTLSSDVEALAAALADRRIDALLICIACYGRRGETVHEMVEANVVTPLRLLQAAALAGLRCAVSVGTALPPSTNLYAMTKAQFVDLARAHESSRLRVCNVRCEMFYGPGDADASKLTNLVFESLSQSRPFLSMSSGREVRDFLYVDDLARALGGILAEECAQAPGFSSYDLGSGVDTTVRAFAELAKRVSGAVTELRFGDLPDRLLPAPIALDGTRIRALGWRPEVDLREGLRRSLTAMRASEI